jgi:hypothetical protein
MNILNFFKRKKEPVTENLQDQKIKIKDNLFHCHYCNEAFEVTAKMQFPVSVPSVHDDYHFQGIGVLCPKCFKTCIYG